MVDEADLGGHPGPLFFAGLMLVASTEQGVDRAATNAGVVLE